MTEPPHGPLPPWARGSTVRHQEVVRATAVTEPPHGPLPPWARGSTVRHQEVVRATAAFGPQRRTLPLRRGSFPNHPEGVRAPAMTQPPHAKVPLLAQESVATHQQGARTTAAVGAPQATVPPPARGSAASHPLAHHATACFRPGCAHPAPKSVRRHPASAVQRWARLECGLQRTSGPLGAGVVVHLAGVRPARGRSPASPVCPPRRACHPPEPGAGSDRPPSAERRSRVRQPLRVLRGARRRPARRRRPREGSPRALSRRGAWRCWAPLGLEPLKARRAAARGSGCWRLSSRASWLAPRTDPGLAWRRSPR